MTARKARSATSRILAEVGAERRSHVGREGRTEDLDDEYTEGQLARAAGWYALNARAHEVDDVVGVSNPDSVAYRAFKGEGFYSWPWSVNWFKPKNRRRDLVVAASLIIAEIERLDRATAKAGALTDG